MLPRRGVAHCVFMLARAARIAPRRSVEEWTAAARAPRSFQAAAFDFEGAAEHLIRVGLATLDDEQLIVSPALRVLSDEADGPTLVKIATHLLMAAPPPWLPAAIGPSGVAREYVPERDLAALSWLEPDLDHILFTVWTKTSYSSRDAFEKAIGEVAELVIFAALLRAGAHPLHVSHISDAYGYDIETRTWPTCRIEVKAAGATTRGSFHISRNEFDQSQRHGPEWRLVQVVFSSTALVADKISSAHVEGVLELSSDALAAAVTPDTKMFRWTESAFVTPRADSWTQSSLALDPAFITPGIRGR
jgi:hypothetical protein